MLYFRNFKTILQLAVSGALVGQTISFLLGATAVGVLGAGMGWPANLAFSVFGIILFFAIYGLYRLLKA